MPSLWPGRGPALRRCVPARVARRRDAAQRSSVQMRDAVTTHAALKQVPASDSPPSVIANLMVSGLVDEVYACGSGRLASPPAATAAGRFDGLVARATDDAIGSVADVSCWSSGHCRAWRVGVRVGSGDGSYGASTAAGVCCGGVERGSRWGSGSTCERDDVRTGGVGSITAVVVDDSGCAAGCHEDVRSRCRGSVQSRRLERAPHGSGGVARRGDGDSDSTV